MQKVKKPGPYIFGQFAPEENMLIVGDNAASSGVNAFKSTKVATLGESVCDSFFRGKQSLAKFPGEGSVVTIKTLHETGAPGK